MDHGRAGARRRERAGLTSGPTDIFVGYLEEGDESVWALPTGQCGCPGHASTVRAP